MSFAFEDISFSLYQEGLLWNLRQSGQLRQAYEQVQREMSVKVIVAIKLGCIMGWQIICPLLEGLTFVLPQPLSRCLCVRCPQRPATERPRVGEPGGNC